MDFDRFVLTASTADLSAEPAARDHADAVEFRMDLADDPLAALDAYDGELPLLVTNRAVWEGGDAPEEGRLATLETAVEHDAVEAVDVELRALTGTAETTARDAAALREHARDHDAAVVVSVHDFERTPPASELRELLVDAAREGDVGKLAVTATDRADTLALLSATYEATAAGETVATMAMGEPGRHTRAVAPLYGSRIGYAPVDPADATAPGQYDLATLAHLVERLDTPEA
ncbi:3-dehydroquinate dehydratase [Halogranum amylolyticum]|uniref:3-dehydroquinate dehydratase n=1 Tax=Halogranum amylolyticum TaxID=660520 RepID=A0A1H8PMN9_9EURY|nr:type I 3-dehydroquinate dehydratase [Halogranum amylolyticum]SEO42964.1 3-dehydroquinate dehydratase [Halogranum amylolyticum]